MTIRSDPKAKERQEKQKQTPYSSDLVVIRYQRALLNNLIDLSYIWSHISQNDFVFIFCLSLWLFSCLNMIASVLWINNVYLDEYKTDLLHLLVKHKRAADPRKSNKYCM